MQIKEIMTPNVETVAEDASIQHAAQRMASMDVGFLPVINNDGPIGVITDRDIAIRAVADGLDPQTTPVSQIMTNDVEILYEDQDVEEAARLMEEKQIRRILICTRDNRFVGVVSLGDLAVDTHDAERCGHTLEKVSSPGH